MGEATLERRCKKYAEQNGWLCYKFTSPSKNKVPDRLFLGKGEAFFVEFKAPGEPPTLGQFIEISKLLKKGIPAVFVDDHLTFMLLVQANKQDRFRFCQVDFDRVHIEHFEGQVPL